MPNLLYAKRSKYIHCRQMFLSHKAAMGTPYATAYRGLFQRADAKPGETGLVHGASGGVGTAAVQLARARGLRVLGTLRAVTKDSSSRVNKARTKCSIIARLTISSRS